MQFLLLQSFTPLGLQGPGALLLEGETPFWRPVAPPQTVWAPKE